MIQNNRIVILFFQLEDTTMSSLKKGCFPLGAMANSFFLLSFSFGMKHDGIHNKCELKDEDEFMYVMSSHLLVASASMKWSPCSKKEITKFVE